MVSVVLINFSLSRFVADRRETFFLLVPDNARQREVEGILEAYEERYGLKLEDE